MVDICRIRDKRRGRGQSLVEFALVLPLLLLVLMISLDFGRAFFAWIGITNASRAGAAYVAANPEAGWATSPNPSIAAVYRSQITTDLLPTNCALPNPIPLPSLNGTSLGSSVTVTLTCTFNTITPLVSSIVGSSIPITATTVYPVRAGQIANGPVLNPGSGLPTPTPVPTVTPTPGPTPALCNAPQMTGLKVSQARAKWTQADFTGPLVVSPSNATDAWRVTAQIPTHPSTKIDCSTSASITAEP